MTDRQLRILDTLVTAYIEQGEPVSSAWLAQRSALGLSSATVRNILTRLEEQGLVRQPHTSAGRVPTDHGYRRYVDVILGAPRRRTQLSAVEARLRQAGTMTDLLEHASQELSRASHQIGFAFAPAGQHQRLQHIDFVPQEGRRVLVIVVTTGGHITHKVIETEEKCDAVQLAQAATYVNVEFAGLTLDEARAAIVEQLQHERMLYDALMKRALTLASDGLDHVDAAGTLHVQGASFLVDEMAAETSDRQRTLEALRVLFQILEEKHQLVDLLTRSIEARGLTVVIGSEHSSPDLHPFSLVTSTFTDGDRTGTVGVIGPTRMRYQRAIAVVDGVSQTVTRVLEGQ